MIFVSHDETFVNNVLNRTSRPIDYSKVLGSGGTESKSHHVAKGTATSSLFRFEGVPLSELWILSKRKLERFDGSFKEYKKIVMKKTSSSMT